MALTPKQTRFVQEYLIDLNAAGAYRRAGYRAKGNAAEAAASRLLRNVKVQAVVSAALAARAQRVEVDQDYVLAGLKREAERRGKFSSASARVRACELLGKHIGMFREQIDLAGAVRMILVEEIVEGANPGTHSNGQAAPGAGRLPPQ